MQDCEYQINLFDELVEMAKREAIPKFETGQRVFVLSLDAILAGAVNRSWVCGREGEDPYFGYSIDLDEGLHTTVWDYNIGKTLFENLEDADKSAACITPCLVKILPNNIQAHDVKVFAYNRNCDGYRLEAIVGKVGDTQLYEKGFCCYHFLRTYPTQKERDKEYKTALNKAQAELQYVGCGEIKDPVYETLYRVTDSLFASREYALNHGAEYAGIRGRIL